MHAGNAAMLSVSHFAELCSKREAGLPIHHWEQKQLRSALKCQVWVVSHITEELTSVYLAEKKNDLPEQIHKNYKLSGQEVDGFLF